MFLFFRSFPVVVIISSVLLGLTWSEVDFSQRDFSEGKNEKVKMLLYFRHPISSVWSSIALIPDTHTTKLDFQVYVLSTTSSTAFIAFSSEVFFVSLYISYLPCPECPHRKDIPQVAHLVTH